MSRFPLLMLFTGLLVLCSAEPTTEDNSESEEMSSSPPVPDSTEPTRITTEAKEISISTLVTKIIGISTAPVVMTEAPLNPHEASSVPSSAHAASSALPSSHEASASTPLPSPVPLKLTTEELPQNDHPATEHPAVLMESTHHDHTEITSVPTPTRVTINSTVPSTHPPLVHGSSKDEASTMNPHVPTRRPHDSPEVTSEAKEIGISLTASLNTEASSKPQEAESTQPQSPAALKVTTEEMPQNDQPAPTEHPAALMESTQHDSIDTTTTTTATPAKVTMNSSTIPSTQRPLALGSSKNDVPTMNPRITTKPPHGKNSAKNIEINVALIIVTFTFTISRF